MFRPFRFLDTRATRPTEARWEVPIPSKSISTIFESSEPSLRTPSWRTGATWRGSGASPLVGAVASRRWTLTISPHSLPGFEERDSDHAPLPERSTRSEASSGSLARGWAESDPSEHLKPPRSFRPLPEVPQARTGRGPSGGAPDRVPLLAFATEPFSRRSTPPGCASRRPSDSRCGVFGSRARCAKGIREGTQGTNRSARPCGLRGHRVVLGGVTSWAETAVQPTLRQPPRRCHSRGWACGRSCVDTPWRLV